MEAVLKKAFSTFMEEPNNSGRSPQGASTMQATITGGNTNVTVTTGQASTTTASSSSTATQSQTQEQHQQYRSDHDIQQLSKAFEIFWLEINEKKVRPLEEKLKTSDQTIPELQNTVASQAEIIRKLEDSKRNKDDVVFPRLIVGHFTVTGECHKPAHDVCALCIKNPVHNGDGNVRTAIHYSTHADK